MIGSLRGVLASKRTGDVIVDVNGVGYLVNLPTSSLSDLPEEGREIFLYIYTHVREDAIQLYGFSDEEQKRIFTSLLNVSGVGPKLALSIVSGIPQRDFLLAIESEDIEMLSRVPGVGKKTAHRVVLELKGKLSPKGTRDAVFEDALSALVNLGYRRAEAVRYLEKAKAGGTKDVEGLLKESLKHISGAYEKS